MKNKRVATPELIGNVLRMFPLELQRDMIFGRQIFDTPPVITIPCNGGSKMLMLDTDENIREGCEFRYNNGIEDARSIGDVFYCISKPNRLQFFDIISNIFEIEEPEYSNILKSIWVSTEFPHQHPIPKLIKLFKRAKPELLMTDEEKSVYNNLSEIVEIYRGLPDKRAKLRGLSWTTDYKKAEWFAKRFNGKLSNIYKAQINKKHIFMYTDERKEHECVVNPRGLKNIRNYSML